MADGSRRDVTFLLTDIEGSTHLLARTGTRYPQLLSEHRSIITAVAVRHHGTALPMEGDACLATFAVPDDAVLAAVGMQRELARHAWGGEQLRVRIGVHRGQAVLRDGEWFGLDLHRAARIAEAGHGGQVLVSASTLSALRHRPFGVHFTDLGLHRLRDLDEPVQLLQVVADGLDDEFPPLRTARPPTHNLPAPTSRLVGRRDDVQAVLELVRAKRLVTLVGPGGVGKTRLAEQVAWSAVGRFPDGVTRVELMRASSAEDVPSLVARTLGVTLSAGAEAGALIGEALREQSCLLLLDNFEHVAAAAGLVEHVLAAAEGVHALVTSRQRLLLTGEQIYPVAPLQVPSDGRSTAASDAVALFIERAQALEPSFAPSPVELDDIAAICRALDGLPLAIELAAAQTRVLSVRRIRERADTPLDALAGRGTDRPPRHRTLRETIAWSFRSLSPDEQRLFARLSVFQAPATIDTIAEVCTDGLTIDTLDGVASLVDKSMLQRRVGVDGEWSFHLLRLLRDYAAEVLARSSDADAVAASHARFQLRFVEQGDEGLLSFDAEAWEDHLNVHLADVRAALEWAFGGGDVALGVRIVAALSTFWYWGGPHADGRMWLTRAAAHDADADDGTRARLDVGLGFYHFAEGHLRTPRRHWQRAVEGFRRAGDQVRTAMTLGLVALTFADPSDDPEQAQELMDEAMTVAATAGNPRTVADAWNMKGEIARLRGDDATARHCYEQALAIVEPYGDLRFAARLEANLAFLAGHAGDHLEALRLLQAALDASAKRRQQVFIAWTLGELAGPEVGLGRPERAARLIGASDAALQRFGVARQPSDQPEHAATLAKLADLLGSSGLDQLRAEGARMSLDDAVAYAQAPVGA